MKKLKVAICTMLLLFSGVIFAACGDKTPKIFEFDSTKFNVTNTEYNYDGDAHIFTVEYEDLDINVTYSLDGTTFVEGSELGLINPGTYNVYYKVTLDGYKDYVSSQVDLVIYSVIDVVDAEGQVGYYADFTTALNEASDGATIKLHTNVIYDGDLSLNNKTLTIDLCDNRLDIVKATNEDSTEVTYKESSKLENSAHLTIKNGKLTYFGLANGTKAAFNINAGCSMDVINIDMLTDGTALFPTGDAASVTVNNSKIVAGTYCVTTNAASTENHNVVITLTNSEFISMGYEFTLDENNNLTSTDYDDCPILINVPGELIIDGCTITGNRQTVIVRGGEATITNSTIINTGKWVDENSTNADKYVNSNWGSGDEVVAAAVVVGNRHSTSYQYKASLTISNTTITAASADDRAIYVYEQNYDATLTATDMIADAITGTITNVNGEVTINDVAY